jgi:hypothetical protein
MSPSQTPPADRRAVDVICLGRLAVDLYAQQLGARLEDVASMAKYLGGSSANIAFGCARLGLRAAMASRVGDDHMGRFLKETLAAEGCDVSHVSVDPDRLSALVLLGIRDRETFPLVFYRQNCADMAVRDEDVEEPFIASSRAFLVTGTHRSSAPSATASRPCSTSTTGRCSGGSPSLRRASSASSAATASPPTSRRCCPASISSSEPRKSSGSLEDARTSSSRSAPSAP